MDKQLVEEITSEFVGCFKTDSDCCGPVARLVATGWLPEGVDPEDERVKAVIEHCRQMKGDGP